MSEKKNHQILKNLNGPQQEAVTHGHGPLLVVAGAGSGKTRVIVHRIAHLITELSVPPQRILALTFTNRAAAEMKERTVAMIGKAGERVTLCTFHALCYRILLQHGEHVGLRRGFTVFDDSDQKSLLKSCLRDLGIAETSSISADKVHHIISNAKNDRKHPAELVSDLSPLGRCITAISDAYEKALIRNNAVDFDNLLLKSLDLFEAHAPVLEYWRSRYTHILVDEYQDTNRVQFLLLRTLAGDAPNVTVVGDQDQSIYAWRGADTGNILAFERAFKGAHSVLLEQNYRSTSHILNAANSLIKHNPDYRGKRLWSELGDGEPARLYEAADERAEAMFAADEIIHLAASGLPHSGMALLFRTRAQSRVLEETLSARGIPFQVVGITGFYQRKEIKDVMAYLRLMGNPDDRVSLARVINVPRRGIGGKGLEKFIAFLDRTGCSTATAAAHPEFETLAANVRGFVKLIDRLRAQAAAMPLAKLISHTVVETGYMDYLKSLEREEAQARRENVQELESVVKEMERTGGRVDLDAFLQRVSLQSDVDSMRDDTPTVKLMTLHCAKGLEFPVIFLTGLEEGLLPHHSSFADRKELAEERRLCYVGVTRAKQRLYLTCSGYRLLFGRNCYNPASRFIKEMNPNAMERVYGPSAYQDEPGFLDDEPAPAPKFVADSSLGDYSVGDAVEHKAFGRGRVVAIKKGEIMVAFDNGKGIKKLAPAYAPLKRL